MALVSRVKEMGGPDTLMTTQGSLLEMTVVEPRESWPLQLSMARPRDQLKGDLGVIALYHRGHSVPLDDTLDMSPGLEGVRAGQGPVTVMTPFETGTWWSSNLERQQSLGSG